MTVPDMSDVDVREMVLRNHAPEEEWSFGGALLSVHCGACGHRWPCKAIKAAREAKGPRIPRPDPTQVSQ